MTGTINYLDAWSLWFNGQQVDPQAIMWGLTVRTWARAGKIAAFFGSGTVVLDVIGSERLRRFAANAQPLTGFRKYVESHGLQLFGLNLFIAFGFVVMWINSTALAFESNDILDAAVARPVRASIFLGMALATTIFMLGRLRRPFLRQVARLFDSEHPAQFVRYTALALLVIGFHFDLLAS